MSTSTSKCPLFAIVLPVIAAFLAFASGTRGATPSAQDEIGALHDALTGDRTNAVAEAMQLTEEESKVFWPLYREYRAAVDVITDGLVKLVVDYADVYPRVPEARARQMLKDYVALEEKYATTRTMYLDKFAKALTAVKAMRLAQLENRMDLLVRTQMSGVVPLAPNKAK